MKAAKGSGNCKDFELRPKFNGDLDGGDHRMLAVMVDGWEKDSGVSSMGEKGRC